MDDQRPVAVARVVAHTLGLMGPSSQVSHNHWSIYLVIDNEHAVQINMTAEPGYITGNLRIDPRQYAVSNSGLRFIDFRTVQGVTVEHVVRLIYENRRHSYDMSGGGSGCRYWVWVIISDLAAKGWLIDTHAGQTLWPYLLWQYSKNADPLALPMVQGTFTDD